MTRVLTYQAGAVRLVSRLARGKVLVERLRRAQPTGLTAEVWPHELTGHPDGMAGIRRMIAALPDTPTNTDQQQEARPRGFLFAHHAADHEREED
mgnify:CR=1 FL=1